MNKARRLSKILLYQGLGFLAIVMLCWTDVLLDLPGLIFKDHPGFSLPIWSCLLQTLLVLTVWFLVSSSTRRVWRRLEHLEGFMQVCSWCRQIDYKGRWMPFEEFLKQSFDTPTTHGICQRCMQEQMTAIKPAKKTPASDSSHLKSA